MSLTFLGAVLLLCCSWSLEGETDARSDPRRPPTATHRRSRTPLTPSLLRSLLLRMVPLDGGVDLLVPRLPPRRHRRRYTYALPLTSPLPPRAHLASLIPSSFLRAGSLAFHSACFCRLSVMLAYNVNLLVIPPEQARARRPPPPHPPPHSPPPPPAVSSPRRSDARPSSSLPLRRGSRPSRPTSTVYSPKSRGSCSRRRETRTFTC